MLQPRSGPAAPRCRRPGAAPGARHVPSPVGAEAGPGDGGFGCPGGAELGAGCTEPTHGVALTQCGACTAPVQYTHLSSALEPSQKLCPGLGAGAAEAEREKQGAVGVICALGFE